METQLKKIKNSAYEIRLLITKGEYIAAEEKAFSLTKDIEMQRDSKEYTPKEYLKLLTFENLFNIGMKEILDKHKDIKFIGEPYDIDKKNEKNGVINFTVKLDVYPEVKVLNKDWEKLTLNAIDGTATEKDIDDAILNLQKNYAEYKGTEELTEKTVSKIGMKFLDKDGYELEKGFVYVGDSEFTAEKKKLLSGKNFCRKEKRRKI